MPSTTSKKSFFDRSSPNIPVEVAETPKKGPFAPTTLLAVADVQLEAAFDEKTSPATRQDLLDRARQSYQKILQQNPNDGPAMLGLARYYTRIGEREKAVEMYKKYITLNPTDKDAPHQVALAHAKWKDWEGAIAWCDFALKLDPESMAIRKTKGFCYASAGMYDKALATFMQLMPEPKAHYQLARVMADQNEFAACRAQLEMVLRAVPDDPAARDFMAALEANTAPGAVDQNALRQIETASYNAPAPPVEAMQPVIQYSPPKFHPLNPPQQPAPQQNEPQPQPQVQPQP